MYSLLDSPSRTFSDRSLFPVDYVIGFFHMVKIQEDAHVEEALQACGYPPWSFSKVRCQMEFIGDKRMKKNKKQAASVKRPVIVIPYVEKVSEAIVRIMMYLSP